MGGPVAVFEVLSPEENVERMLVKLDDYANMGIPYIRVIDPKTQVIYEYVKGGLRPVTSSVEELPDGHGSIDWGQVSSAFG
jgi:Uma2 family endonuclease